MNSVMDYRDVMDTSEDIAPSVSIKQLDTNAPSGPVVAPFRTKSLLFVTFPWSTSLPVVSSKLAEQLGDYPETHCAFVGLLFLRSFG